MRASKFSSSLLDEKYIIILILETILDCIQDLTGHSFVRGSFSVNRSIISCSTCLCYNRMIIFSKYLPSHQVYSNKIKVRERDGGCTVLRKKRGKTKKPTALFLRILVLSC